MYYRCSEIKGADQLRSNCEAVTAKLICAFAFVYADCWFSHAAAQFIYSIFRIVISAGIQRSTYAFSVYNLSESFLTYAEPVVFGRKLLDEGGLYDTSTGKYNVPVSGLYFFTANLCTTNNDYASVKFVADGTRLGAFNFGDAIWNLCSTGSAIAKLQKNTKVWLKTVAGFVANTEEIDGRFNYFSGYLINEEY